MNEKRLSLRDRLVKDFIRKTLSESRKEEKERVCQLFVDAYFDRKDDSAIELYRVFRNKLK